MNREELMEHLTNQKVYLVCRNTRRELNLLPPDAKKNHRLPNIIFSFDSEIEAYRAGEYPNKGETFAELCKANPARYRSSIEAVFIATNRFGIKV
jgi:hypothetical protein